jgi:NAD(P)-dependent dehydrogenase (short-subunit alcohol dehydrogenase family)
VDLTGKVAVVTGSGRGLGLAYASEPARAGAAVVINDVDALAAGEPLPPHAREQLGFGRPQDSAGPVAFLASDAAAGITGQAVGIDGDRLALWSHPSEVAVEFADGSGWSADAIAGVWPGKFAASQQTVGQQFEEPAK